MGHKYRRSGGILDALGLKSDISLPFLSNLSKSKRNSLSQKSIMWQI